MNAHGTKEMECEAIASVPSSAEWVSTGVFHFFPLDTRLILLEMQWQILEGCTGFFEAGKFF